ncbi:MAG: hypothetical protein JSU66_07380 [Deltaproteobacteria bacterium]|nr:MAG: hypothetical protein JSU66_07380 [Deltaproteobacteria bacterium]
MEILKGIGFGALGILVLGWLTVSFLAPGRVRSIVEWIAATAAFAALLVFFVSLTARARAEDMLIGVIGFGALSVLFALGFSVSVYKTLREIFGGAGAGPSTTN